MVRIFPCAVFFCFTMFLGHESSAQFLLDLGSVPDGSGRTLAGVDGNSDGWVIFQAFDLGEPWAVETIGVDGWARSDLATANFSGTICADDGTENMADCSIQFGSTSHELDSDASASSWSDSQINVVLAPGQYWYRLLAEDPSFSGGIFRGSNSGPTSYSIRGSDGERFNSTATALRIRGVAIPEPGSVGLLTCFLLAAVSRRKSPK